MNKNLMTQLETVCREGCRSLAQARELIPGDWKLPLEADFQSLILQSIAEWAQKGHIPPRSFWWKESASPYQRRGIPDILLIINGRFCAFEVKRPFDGWLRDSQALVIKLLREAGAVAAVVSFPGEVREILEKEGLWK